MKLRMPVSGHDVALFLAGFVVLGSAIGAGIGAAIDVYLRKRA